MKTEILSRRWWLMASALLVLFVGGPLVSRAAAPTAWTPELMMKVKDIGSVVPSPDGKRVAYVVTEAVMDFGEVLTVAILRRWG